MLHASKIKLYYVFQTSLFPIPQTDCDFRFHFQHQHLPLKVTEMNNRTNLFATRINLFRNFQAQEFLLPHQEAKYF